MSFRRLAIMNLSMYGYGHIRTVGNIGVTSSVKGFMTNDQFKVVLANLTRNDPELARNL